MKTIWNDTDIPLAYLITFRTYGTWLHGDERGSIDRIHNQYKSPLIAPDKNWYQYNVQRVKSKAVILDSKQRKAVEIAVREVCEQRKWILRAINVRTNHVHTVVLINSDKPEKALNDFKAYSTRKMRQSDYWKSERSSWSDKGSKRHLWNEHSVGLVVDYVINGQGDQLPDFD